MKKLLFLFPLIVIGHILYGQTDEQKVKDVLSSYKSALERLDVKGTDVLFTANSQIIESGKVEGTYPDYLAHHIGPELGEFNSFRFENYNVEVTVAGDYAFAVETYNYAIVLKKDNSEVRRRGVASSFLKKDNGSWKIVHMHNSSRKP